MEKWTPIFWIVGSGLGYFALLLLLDSVKGLFEVRKKDRA